MHIDKLTDINILSSWATCNTQTTPSAKQLTNFNFELKETVTNLIHLQYLFITWIETDNNRCKEIAAYSKWRNDLVKPTKKFNIKQNQCRFCELKLVWDWQHLAQTTWTYIHVQSQFSGSAFNDLNKPINKLPVKLHANRTYTSLTSNRWIETDNIWCHQLLAAWPEQINKTKCLLQAEPVQTAN